MLEPLVVPSSWRQALKKSVRHELIHYKPHQHSQWRLYCYTRIVGELDTGGILAGDQRASMNGLALSVHIGELLASGLSISCEYIL